MEEHVEASAPRSRRPLRRPAAALGLRGRVRAVARRAGGDARADAALDLEILGGAIAEEAELDPLAGQPAPHGALDGAADLLRVREERQLLAELLDGGLVDGARGEERRGRRRGARGRPARPATVPATPRRRAARPGGRRRRATATAAPRATAAEQVAATMTPRTSTRESSARLPQRSWRMSATTLESGVSASAGTARSALVAPQSLSEPRTKARADDDVRGHHGDEQRAQGGAAVAPRARGSGRGRWPRRRRTRRRRAPCTPMRSATVVPPREVRGDHREAEREPDARRARATIHGRRSRSAHVVREPQGQREEAHRHHREREVEEGHEAARGVVVEERQQEERGEERGLGEGAREAPARARRERDERARHVEQRDRDGARRR